MGQNLFSSLLVDLPKTSTLAKELSCLRQGGCEGMPISIDLDGHWSCLYFSSTLSMRPAKCFVDYCYIYIYKSKRLKEKEKKNSSPMYIFVGYCLRSSRGLTFILYPKKSCWLHLLAYFYLHFYGCGAIKIIYTTLEKVLSFPPS